MCGIAGIVSRVPIDSLTQIKAMNASLAHRGPDHQGFIRHGNVLLGHSRLSLLEIGNGGDQPMSTPDGRWHLVFNGEVFNQGELRDSLPMVPFRGRSDTETLLHALAERGVSVLSELNGFFAFALHDTARHELLLVRDRFGVKPLYYAIWNGQFLFASEMKAILSAGFPRRLDEAVLRNTLSKTWTQGEQTPIAGIRRVLPGELLRLSTDDLAHVRERWFDLSDLVDPAQAANLERTAPLELSRLLKDHLVQAVDRRLEADVPVGTLCSGGLDSSLVTALAARRHPGIRAYHVETFGRWNERPYADAVAQAVGAELVPVPMTAQAWREKFVACVEHFEYPLWHESSIPLSLIADAARRDGVKALLGGEAADELLGGYDYKHAAEREAFSLLSGCAASLPTGRREDWVEDHGFLPFGNEEPELPTALEYRRAVKARLLPSFAHHVGPRADLEATLTAELQLFLLPGLTRVDKNLMQGSVEYREPFLDLDLVRFATNLPLEAKLYPTVKSILRSVADEFLPLEIIHRPKLGFSFDPKKLFTTSLRPEFLNHAMLKEILMIDRKEWQNAVSMFRGRALFRLLSSEIWLRLFLAKSTADAINERLWM